MGFRGNTVLTIRDSFDQRWDLDGLERRSRQGPGRQRFTNNSILRRTETLMWLRRGFIADEAAKRLPAALVQ